MGEAVEHFSYDKVGNRTTDAKTGTNQWDYNQNNELQSFDNTSFKYNLNGQMTEKTVNGTKTYYSYNLDGRLKEIRDNSNQVIAQYEYDPFGRRVKKHLSQTNETIYFHYSDEGLIAEYNETGQLIQTYGYKPDSLFTTNPVFTHRPDFADAKGYTYYINDHLGTSQKLITETGRKVWEASADAFGKTIITNDEFRNPLRFPGQYTDEESFLRYNYFRYYDPQLGRYITSDPIGLEGGLNTYSYALNNPLYWIDSLGLDTTSDPSKSKKLSELLPSLKDIACVIQQAAEAENHQQQNICDETHKNETKLIEEGCNSDYENCFTSDDFSKCYTPKSQECERLRNEEIKRYIKEKNNVDNNYPVNQDLSNICK